MEWLTHRHPIARVDPADRWVAEAPLSALALLDGRPVTGDRDGRLWFGQRPVRAHEGPITSLCASGGLLASAGRDGHVALWDACGRPLCVFADHRGGVAAAVLSGAVLVTVGDDGRALARDLHTGETDPIGAVDGRLSALAVRGDRVAIGTARGLVLDESGTERRHAGAVNALAFTDDGRLVSAGVDGVVRVGTTALSEHDGQVLAVATSGDRLVTAGQDRRIVVWSLGSLGIERVLCGHEQPVQALVMDGGVLWSVSSDRSRIRWSLDARPLPTPMRHAGSIRACVEQDGRVVTAGRDGVLCVWDPQRGVRLHTLRGHEGSVEDVAIRGDRAVSVSTDGTSRLWDLDRGVCVGIRDEARGPLSCCAWLGETPITGGRDGWLRIGERLVPVHADCVRSIAVQNGRIVTAGYDGTVRLWDASGQELGLLSNHGAPVVRCVFGRGWLASGSVDGCVRLWGRSQELRLDAPVSGLHVDPADRLWAGTSDGRLVRFDPDSGETKQVALDAAIGAMCGWAGGVVVGDRAGNVHVLDESSDPALAVG